MQVMRKKPLPKEPSRRDSVNVDGVQGFSEMLEEADKLVLDGQRGNVTVAVAKWGFEARNDTELSLAVGDEVLVLDQHDSGWWTGQKGNKTGFFPANRTETRQVNLKAYSDAERQRHSTPMFRDDDAAAAAAAAGAAAPALPDPMVKAGKILGISEQEALALSPRPRNERAASVGGEGLVSPRKALNVMGFDEEQKHRSSFSGLSRMTLKMSNGIRRLTGSGASTPDRKGSVGGGGGERKSIPGSPVEEHKAPVQLLSVAPPPTLEDDGWGEDVDDDELVY